MKDTNFIIFKSKVCFLRTFARRSLFLCVWSLLFAKSFFAQDFAELADRLRFGNQESKRQALFELRKLRSAEASRLASTALRDTDEIVRATAAFSVIHLPEEEAFAALAPNLSDRAEIVRRETAYALGKIQYPQSIQLLIETYRTDKSRAVKSACVIALGEIGDISAVDFLTQILRQKPKKGEGFLRRSAARAIGQIAQMIQINESYIVTPESFLPEQYKIFTLEKYRDLSENFPSLRRAVPLLIQILQDRRENDDTKREAAFALGAIGNISALSVLESNLNSNDYYLAEICKEAVRKLRSVKKNGKQGNIKTCEQCFEKPRHLILIRHAPLSVAGRFEFHL